MKLLSILPVVLCGSLAACAQGTAGPVDGNELLPMCKATLTYLSDNHGPQGDEFSQGYCPGLVTGVSETSDDVCSLGVPSVQMVRVVVKYLEDHPDRLN